MKNVLEAYELIDQVDCFKLCDLKKVHQIMTKSLINLPGAFRTNQESVFDGDKCIFMAPPYNSVPSLMESLFTWLNTNKETIHPLILSCVFHYEFVFIHSFQDGSG